ncbi:MAG: ferredoxin [Spirochaetales bacterium]|nr:ferredoxin [Spirochaetales bacterium]
MKISCNIDGTNYSLSVNSDKPLLQILIDDIGIDAMKSICRGAYCGNCIVLLDGQAVLSCLVPAFKIQGATIQTFDSFQKTRFFRDIDRAYIEVGCIPCPQCFASKTMIIESILQTLEKKNAGTENGHLRRVSEIESARREQERFVIQELTLNSCTCTESSELAKVVEVCLNYRRRRNVRRS